MLYQTRPIHTPIETISGSCLVELETIEIIATMWALVQFVQHSRRMGEGANESLIEIAETLIIRFQDVLDEDQIGMLCRQAA